MRSGLGSRDTNMNPECENGTLTMSKNGMLGW